MREHGFTSPHTVIEMVNDDMPFLVDSINLALTERELTLHFLTHPIFAVARDGAGNLLALHERGEASKGGKPPVEIRIISPNTMETTSDAKTGCTKNQSGPSTVCL